MRLTEREQEIMAVLFASGDPIDIERMAESMDITAKSVVDSVESLALQLKNDRYPLEIKKLNNAYQLCTKSRFDSIIHKTLMVKRNMPLSPAAMETLAVIAYNQPVTRSFIEQVRGVDSSSIVTTLMEKGLVEEAGRLDLPGRPIALKTTDVFLRCFNLESLDALPEVLEKDYAEEKEELKDENNSK